LFAIGFLGLFSLRWKFTTHLGLHYQATRLDMLDSSRKYFKVPDEILICLSQKTNKPEPQKQRNGGFALFAITFQYPSIVLGPGPQLKKKREKIKDFFKDLQNEPNMKDYNSSQIECS